MRGRDEKEVKLLFLLLQTRLRTRAGAGQRLAKRIMVWRAELLERSIVLEIANDLLESQQETLAQCTKS